MTCFTPNNELREPDELAKRGNLENFIQGNTENI